MNRVVVCFTSTTPSASFKAAINASLSASGAITNVGSPDPAGKCSESFSKPTTESGLPVNASEVASPLVLSCVANDIAITKNSPVTIQVCRGFLPTKPATFDQSPESCSSASSCIGRLGQNIHRPASTRIAGSIVSITNWAASTPIAATGPSDRTDFRSDKPRTNRPEMTVRPEAVIGSTTPFHATTMASTRLS